MSGVACVGSAYGMARYGFGLLLPDMRAALRLSDAATAAMAAAGYAVYLAVSLRTGGLVARRGPRATVMAGGGCAVAGMLLAAAAPSALVLGIAVAVAGASAALVFPPFADAIAAVVPGPNRARAFAWVSSGTGAGVAVAAPLAFVAADWRLAWVLFAVVAALTTLLAARVVPAAPLAPAQGRRAGPRPRDMLPLLASALLVGLGAAVFWTWAVDRVATDGGLGTGAAQALLAIVGVASLGGALGVTWSPTSACGRGPPPAACCWRPRSSRWPSCPGPSSPGSRRPSSSAPATTCSSRSRACGAPASPRTIPHAAWRRS